MKHEEWPYPNLVILDGGIGQVNAVKDLLREKQIAVIGRDKSGDHTRNAEVNIIMPEGDSYKTLHLSPDSHIAKLIARIDDEAHRFAITYHSLLKRKKCLSRLLCYNVLMIKKQIFVFILRWAASSLGMWFCITQFGKITSTEAYSEPWVLYVIAGLIFLSSTLSLSQSSKPSLCP